MLLLLLLITPLGLDLSYYEGVFALKLRVGFLRLTLPELTICFSRVVTEAPEA